MIGIIDYFQKYTWSKALEKMFKKTKTLSYNLDTSSQPSGFYAKRFIKFMSEIFEF